MGAPLVKSASVLNHAEPWDTERFVFFFSYEEAEMDDPATSTDRAFSLSREDWDEFGRPEVITVTVEPGDRLN
jgi:hypothetical protein